MRSPVDLNSFNQFPCLVLEHPNNQSSCIINPAFGANILQLFLDLNGKRVPVFDGFKNESQMIANEKSRGIHLAPFPNRIKNGNYVFEGKKFQLPINKPKENNAIHGFVWNQKFELREQTTDSNAARMLFEYQYEGETEGYPFPFVINYLYELNDEGLTIEVNVRNTGTSSLPLGIGWHPYFSFGTGVESLKLQLPDCRSLAVDQQMIPTGERAEYEHFKFPEAIGKTEFDTAFELKGEPESFTTKLFEPEEKITLQLVQSASFRFLQVYLPPDRNSIALEPMTCPANAFNSGEGLIVLKSGEQFSGWIKVMLKA